MYSLIGSVVIMCEHEAGALTGMFVHTLRFKYGQFRHQTDLCTVQKQFARVLIAHTCVNMLHSSSATQSLILDVSTCNVICHCHDDPTNGPIGDPSMVRLP